MLNLYLLTVKKGILEGVVKENFTGYDVLCKTCNEFRFIKNRESVRRSLKENKKCDSCAQSINKKGLIHSENTKQKMSISHIERYKNPAERFKTSIFVKKAMHVPEIRKNHIEKLFHSKWIKVRTDKGQLELLNKWNLLGFNFEINYQIKIDNFLYYIDGYDKEKNVVLEFDSKYHFRKTQQEKDLIRQTKIIKSLSPTVFWRFDSVKNKFNVVYRKLNNIY